MSDSRVAVAAPPTRTRSLRLVAVTLLTGAIAVPLSCPAGATPSPHPPVRSLLRPASAPAAATVAAGQVTPEALLAGHLSQRAQSALLRGHLAGIVLDGDTGATLWATNATTGVMPASLTKVATAVAAYRWLGPDKRLTTSVLRGLGSANVVLRGGGDPMLTSADLTAMAATAAVPLRAAKKTTIAVLVDDRLFPAPTNAIGWRPSYVPGEISPVRALGVHGRTSRDTAIDAGNVFATALSHQGFKVVAVRRGAAPAHPQLLATTISPTVKGLVGRMLLASDNQIAETLLKMSAKGAGMSATWANSAHARDLALASIGAPSLKLLDGSGLSRSSRISAQRFALMLRAISTHADYAPIVTSLPVSGVSGTLAKRYRSAPASCARSDVSAKTGTLDDIVGLGGVARTADGKTRFFTFVRTGKRASAKSVAAEVDKLAATVVGCW